MISEDLVADLIDFFGQENWPYLIDPSKWGIVGIDITADTGERTLENVLVSHAYIYTKHESWRVFQTIFSPEDTWKVIKTTDLFHLNPRNFDLAKVLDTIAA